MKKASTLKKARLEPPSNKKPKQDCGDDSKSTVLVALDPVSLECPLCFEPFVAAIYQCKNGHAACESCCSRIRRVCGYCGETVGDIRCRPLENAIAGMALPCAFAKYGCTRRVRYADKRDHEERCPKAPCDCPIDRCTYSGSDEDLHWHIVRAHTESSTFYQSTKVTLHRASPFLLFLRPVDEHVFLLVNGGGVPTGRSLSVVCLGHPPDGDQALKYAMEVRAGDSSSAALPLSASGPVTYIRRWAGNLPVNNAFLFVPDAYWSSSGTVSVTVDFLETTIGDA